MNKSKKKPAPVANKLPASHLIALYDAGFTTLAYLPEYIRVELADGTQRKEWLPRLCIPTVDSRYRALLSGCQKGADSTHTDSTAGFEQRAKENNFGNISAE